MGYALKIYQAFKDDNEEKAKVLAEAFEELEKRYPQLTQMSTKADLNETELRLIQQIEETRKEIKEVELKLSKQIENTRKEIKEIELKLIQQIENTRKEIKETELKLTKEIKKVELNLSKEIKAVEVRMIKWMFTFWTGQLIALIGILKYFFT